MNELVKLTDDEKAQIDDLTSLLIENTGTQKSRVELFGHLATLVAGVKLGLTVKESQKPAA